MCIAIVKPANTLLSKESAQNSYESNPHGAGFAYLKKGEVLIRKGFFSFQDFWRSFNPIQKKNSGAMLVHFRIATAGGVDAMNCHPWRIDKQHAMIHNGMLPGFSFHNSHVSDTGLFTEMILKKFFAHSPNLWREGGFNWMLSESIGSYNKIAILGADGHFELYNKNNWVYDEDDGLWYSNYGYQRQVRSWHDHDEDYMPQSKPKKRYYKLPNDDKHLTCGDVKALKEKHLMTLLEMVENGIVERIEIDDDEPTDASLDPKKKEYKDWWLGQKGSRREFTNAQLSDSLENEHYSG